MATRNAFADLATEATLATVAGAVRAEDTVHASGDAGIMAFAVRNDVDGPLAANGDYSPLQTGSTGRLKTSVEPVIYPLTTGSITANAQTIFGLVDRASNVMVFMVATTLVGHNVIFEGSLNSTNGTDGNWFGIQAVRSNSNIIEATSGVLAATPAYAWKVSVNGLTYFRVRATSHTSGTAAYQILRGAYATEPIPAAQVTATQPISGAISLVSTALAPNAGLGAGSTFNVISAATTNATLIKALAGNLNDVTLSNDGPASVFVKLYNKATAPVVGTDIPVRTILVGPKATVQVGFGTYGYRFPLGLGVGVTTGAANNNTGAVALDQVIIAGSFT